MLDYMNHGKRRIALAILATAFSVTPAHGESETRIQVEIEEPVRALIPLIAANEGLFYDAEIVFSQEYENVSEKGLSQLVHDSRIEAHQIRQGDLYWLKYDHLGKSNNGEKYNDSQLSGYDGNTTKVWRQGSYANLYLDRWESSKLLHPHKLMGFAEDCTISQYLQTGFSRRKVTIPNGKIDERITRLADDKYLGKSCIVLERHLVMSGFDKNETAPTHFVQRLWICPEVNYLPLKSENSDAGSYIKGKTQVEELSEIEPGVFFPKKVTTSVYDKPNKPTDAPRVNNTRLLTVKSVTLKPNYPKSRFAEVNFKDGSLVYVVRNGSVVFEFVAGPDFDLESLNAKMLAASVTDPHTPILASKIDQNAAGNSAQTDKTFITILVLSFVAVSVLSGIWFYKRNPRGK
jgi:hypothetical protein